MPKIKNRSGGSRSSPVDGSRNAIGNPIIKKPKSISSTFSIKIDYNKTIYLFDMVMKLCQKYWS